MRRFAALLVLATALGCGGDSSTSTNEPITGTYNLVSVNSIPLPFTVLQSDSVKFEIISDSFTLTADKNWTESGSSRTTASGQVTTDPIADSGTYVLSGSNITLISANGSIDGTIGGGKLRLVNDALVALYQK